MVVERGPLKIGEFAEQAGTNLRTLRYYEELGLIQPVARSAGGFRLYSPSQLARVQAIRRLQELGLSLKEIAETIPTDGRDAVGTELLERVESALGRQIGLIDRRIDELEGDLRELREARQRLVDRCRACELSFSPDNCDPCALDQRAMHDAVRALF